MQIQKLNPKHLKKQPLYVLWNTLNIERKKQSILLLFLMTIGSLMEAVSIGAILPFLGALTDPKSILQNEIIQHFVQIFEIRSVPQFQFAMAIMFAVVALVSGSFRLALMVVNIRLGNAIGADISVDIYRRTLYSSYTVHLTRNSSEVVASVLNKSSHVVQNTILPLFAISSSFFVMASIIFALIAIDHNISLFTLGCFLIIYIVVYGVSRKKLYTNGSLYNMAITKAHKELQEGLSGIKDVLLNGAQEIYCKTFREIDLQHRQASANIAIYGNSPRYAIETLGLVLLSIISYVLSGRTGGLNELVPTLGALALGSLRLLAALQQVYSSWAAIRGSNAALRDVTELLQQPLPTYAMGSAIKPIQFKECVELQGVNFQYDQNGLNILKEVDLIIPKCSRVGLIGETGGGKSTLIDIIMGLLTPTSGVLKIDGKVISAENAQSWQCRVAHVPQDIFISDASIAENIAFGVAVKNIDIDLMKMAAKKAHLSDLIEGWEQKYETIVGERGARLSGGQRQRIGIARALYKQAEVIIFDEATSSLNTEIEETVMKEIYSLGSELTLIMVAHRLTTLKECTCIYEINKGRVEHVGTYDQVIKKSRDENPD